MKLHLNCILEIDTDTNNCSLVSATIKDTLTVEQNVDNLQPTAATDQPADSKTLVEQLKEVSTVSNKTLSKSTISNRNDAIKALYKFLCHKYGEDQGINTEDLTPDLLLDFEEHYIATHGYTNTSVNTAACHMRNLRAMVGKVVGQQRASELFRGVSKKPQPTESRALTEEELNLFANITLPPRLEAARTTGLLQYGCMGMSYCDLIRQRIFQLAGNYICYKRKKTKSQIQVPVTQAIRDLCSKLSDGSGGSTDYLLPDLAGSTPETEERMASSALRKYNRNLNEIGKLMGLKMPLTSYCFRHTFATLASEKGKDDGLVSKMMGHSRREITEIYIRKDQKKIDELSLKLQYSIIPHLQMASIPI